MYTYSIICWTITVLGNCNEYSKDKYGAYYVLKGHTVLHRPRGIILIESTKIRWFSRQSGGGGLFLLLKAKNLKTTQVRSSGSSLLRLDGSCGGQAGGWVGYPVAAQGLYSLKLKPRNYQA
jgi:hypothetical protein